VALPNIGQSLRQFLDRTPGNWEVVLVLARRLTLSQRRLVDQLAWFIGGARKVYCPVDYQDSAVALWGLQAARGAWRVVADANLSFDLDTVYQVAQQLWAGADVVIGSRLLPESLLNIPTRLQGRAYQKRLQWQFLTAAVRRLLGLAIRDVGSPLQGFTNTVIDVLLEHLSPDDSFSVSQLPLLASHFGHAIIELPADYHFQDDGRQGLVQICRSVAEMIQLRKWLFSLRGKQSRSSPRSIQLRKSA
jgi:hypothetical protein